MTARLALPAALLALSPAAHADGLSGWWEIAGREKTAEQAQAYAPAGKVPRETDSRWSAPQKDAPPGAVYGFSAPPQDPAVSGGKPNGIVGAAPYSRLPDSCGFSGHLIMKEITGKPTECTMTLLHSCSGRPPGNHFTVVQACTVTREGDKVTIKGSQVAIAEAAPPHIWPTTYSPDIFILTLSSDGKSMKGENTRKIVSTVSASKIADLAE